MNEFWRRRRITEEVRHWNRTKKYGLEESEIIEISRYLQECDGLLDYNQIRSCVDGYMMGQGKKLESVECV